MKDDGTGSAFLLGGWRTDGTQRVAMLNAIRFREPKMFRIWCDGSIDGIHQGFGIRVDTGGIFVSTLNEGGTALVEARQISIYQNQESGGSGGWSVITDDQVPFHTGTWEAPPGRITLLVSLEEAHDVLVSLNDTSPGCSDGRMSVYVDGQALTDVDGRALVLLRGSSVLVRGRKVEVRLEGDCRPDTRFVGTVNVAVSSESM
jgi:hypothetical protein